MKERQRPRLPFLAPRSLSSIDRLLFVRGRAFFSLDAEENGVDSFVLSEQE